MTETTHAEGTMVSLCLPAEAVEKLRDEAARQGLSLEAHLQHLLVDRCSPERNGKHPGSVVPTQPKGDTSVAESLEDTYDYKPMEFPEGPTIKVRFVMGEPWTPQPYPEEE